MKHRGYQISLYERNKMTEVVRLLGKNLWRGDGEQNWSYFKWKYHDNPYANQPLAVIASHERSIVGFRGYFATSWYLGSNDNRVVILEPADTVVHPEHRRNGLSVAMGNFAMDQFAAKYSVLLNTSAGKNAIPGYLRLGFVSLGKKAYYRRSSFPRDVSVIWRGVLKRQEKEGDLPASRRNVLFGEFGDVVVSKSPGDEDMSRVAFSKNELPAKIRLLQDQVFFRWRFENPKGRYVFYFYRQADAIVGYLVMLVSNDMRQGFIVDYGQKRDGAIGEILDHIAKMAEVEEVDILNIGVDDHLWEPFKSREFKKWGLHRLVKKIVFNEQPILVRPVKRQCSEDDWFLGGLGYP